MNYSSDLKNFANSWPSVSNFKSFSQSLEQFFLTVGQNNFGNKIPIFVNSGGFSKRGLANVEHKNGEVKIKALYIGKLSLPADVIQFS